MADTRVEKLPNGICYNGEVLREIELVKFDGEHEDLLHDKKVVLDGQVIDKLIKMGIARIGSYTDPKIISDMYDKHLIMPDQTFVLVKLRMFGISKMYSFVAKCSGCGHKDQFHIDLNTLQIDEQKEEFRGKTEFDAIVTPEDEKAFRIKFRHLFAGKDPQLLSSIEKQHGSDKATRELLLQLKEINGKSVSAADIKKLSYKARLAIREEMDKTVGGINVELIMECAKCNEEFTGPMPIKVRDFFYPKGSKNSTPRLAKPFQGYGGTPTSSEESLDGQGAK